MKNADSQELQEQIHLLFVQLHNKELGVHEFMKLLDMAYKDYLDFHPEDRPDYYDRNKVDKTYDR